MKIATTTGDFRRYFKSDVEIIRQLRQAGFRCIDLNMYSFTPDSPYMNEGWEKQVKALADEAKSLGMTFVQAHSQGGNPLSDDKDHVDFLIKATLRSLEICKVLGIPNTVVHSGFAKDMSKDEWFIKNKEFYEKLLPTAERLGVNVLCENSTDANMKGRYFINSGKDMREFIDYVAHPNFHGCWDTGHANCEGEQYDEIMAIGNELYAIHYNDNGGAKDNHVAPFMGSLNHDEIMNALIDVGFKGIFTLECDNALITYEGWPLKRRHALHEGENPRLREPQLFMQQHIEKMMYETAEWMLKSYNLYE